jgi:hypothetical protein
MEAETTNPEKCKMLEESPGVTSSKRVWGTVLLALGCAVGAGATVLSYVFARDSSVAIDVMQTMMLAGSALLGIGVIPDCVKRRQG